MGLPSLSPTMSQGIPTHAPSNKNAYNVCQPALDVCGASLSSPGRSTHATGVRHLVTSVAMMPVLGPSKALVLGHSKALCRRCEEVSMMVVRNHSVATNDSVCCKPEYAWYMLRCVASCHHVLQHHVSHSTTLS